MPEFLQRRHDLRPSPFEFGRNRRRMRGERDPQYPESDERQEHVIRDPDAGDVIRDQRRPGGVQGEGLGLLSAASGVKLLVTNQRTLDGLEPEEELAAFRLVESLVGFVEGSPCVLEPLADGMDVPLGWRLTRLIRVSHEGK
jgi:hypothetical protein